VSTHPGVPNTTSHLGIREEQDETWKAHALCAQVDPEIFFPHAGDRAREAKDICAACPVTAACLAYALRHYEAGIWGGKTEYERRQIRNTTRLVPGRPRPKTLGGRTIPDLAHRMRDWRLTRGLTQQAAAERYGPGVTKNMVADYETGRHQPHPTVLARIDNTIGDTA
jgi:WhiB family redox-sensing transcriptional regulator